MCELFTSQSSKYVLPCLGRRSRILDTYCLSGYDGFRGAWSKRNLRVLQKPSRVVGVVGPSTPESVNLMRLMLLSMTEMGSLSLVKNVRRIVTLKF